ncbi:MAG: PAS domain-containing sensor histidine kinase [Ignavibacteriaceae bacterium]
MKNKNMGRKLKTGSKLSFLSSAVYIILFFILLPIINEFSIIWALIPVSTIAFFTGFRKGLIAAFFFIITSVLLLKFSGYSFSLILASSWQSIISILTAGVTFGLLYDVLKNKRISDELLEDADNHSFKDSITSGKSNNEIPPEEKQNLPVEIVPANSSVLKEIDNLNEELRKKDAAKQQLVESNSRLKLALDASENGFADLKLAENKIYFSPILTKHLGYTKEELDTLISKWEDYVHLDDLDKVKDAISNLMTNKLPSTEVIHRLLTKTGHWKWFLTKIKIVETDKLKNPVRLFIVIEDISLRKKAEEELLNNLAKEQQLAEMRSRFVTLVSHEFRTPLSTILSSVELLENYGSTWPKEKSSVYYRKIEGSIDYLISLLNEISLMSKAESTVLSLKPEKLELVSFFEELIDEVKGNFKTHPVIHFNINRREFNTEHDKKLLRFIFHNLLVNAVKYTEAEKNIFIYCIFNPSEIFLSITDEGMGIPKEEQKTLFDPFTRASNVGDIKGTGLGLSIVKKTVEVCRGKIYLESELNKGTSFKVILPLLNYNN